MTRQNEFQSVCSVAELARRLGFSRSRFYELQETGVFPRPVYGIRSKRPFYFQDMQQLCIEIRRTGIGFNGMPVVFYVARKKRPAKVNTHSMLPPREILETLKQMGIKVTGEEITKAFESLYPTGIKPVQNKGAMIRDLFKYFSGDQNGV